MTKHHKSILAVVDEIVSYSSVCSTSDESEFLKFARNQEDCRLKWLKSEEANRMLQERIFQLQAEKEALDVKLKHARNQIDIEMQRRRKAETGQEELASESDESDGYDGEEANIAGGAAGTSQDTSVITTTTVTVPSSGPVTAATHIETIPSLQQNFQRPQPLQTRSKPTRDHMKLNQGTRPSAPPMEDDTPPKRRSIEATAKRDTSVITTTTVTVPSSGPVTAATHIETIPSLQQNFQRPQPLQTRSKPTRDHMKLNQDNSPAPKSPVLSPQSAPSQSPKKPQRPHTFVTKTVIKPESCNPCGKRIKFGKYALKCKDCRAVCHPDCKEMVALPCVPSASTPGKKLSNTLGDYVPTSSPLVPAIVVHCIAEVERRGLMEEGVYRVPGSEKAVKDLKEKILRSKGNPQLEKVPDIHVVCGTLKDFLRHLDEPLVTYKLHKAFMNATEYSDNEDGITAIYQAISELPQANRDTLAYLILHLQRVTECPTCRMPSANLAKVFGPTIVGHSCADPEPMVMLNDTKKQPKVIHLLMSLPSDFWRAFINIDTENVHGGSNNIIANNNAGTPGENSGGVKASVFRSQMKREKTHSVNLIVGKCKVTDAHCSCQSWFGSRSGNKPKKTTHYFASPTLR
ncbi:rac GTPase-activating protein 1-like [Anneissia japonica]|uniref:rac GTPase-activating protein 1-like n=1 Tax=Anneissia japonica TaxID=1529436 RepID=UPI00142563A8|nr:rac GTPase-activating protein 1-like [Anneissia japonica]